MVTQSVVVGETMTGRRLMAVPVSACSWSASAGGDGSVDATIPLASADFQTIVPHTSGTPPVTVWTASGSPLRDILVATEPVRCFVAVLADDRVIAGGPIITQDWDETAGTLALHGVGAGWLMSRRLAVPASYAGRVQDQALDYTGLSLGSIIDELVTNALAQAGGTLPVVVGASVAGTSERHYEGFKLSNTGTLIDQISKVDGGPEYAFEPRLTSDLLGVEWVLRTGTETDPVLRQIGQDWLVDMSVPRGGLGGLRVRVDGSAMTTRAWASGSGMDTALMVAIATDLTASAARYPLLDSVRAYPSDEHQATLDAHAQGDVTTNRRPWVTWTLKVPVDERLGAYRCGDYWSVRIGANHPYLPPGIYRSRMASHSGALSEQMVSVTLVPTEMSA